MVFLLVFLVLGFLVFLNVLFMEHGLLEHDWGSSGDVVLYDAGEPDVLRH